MDWRRGRTRSWGTLLEGSSRSSWGDALGDVPSETPQARANSSSTSADLVPAGR
jgi:hypothetical protein